MAYIRQLPSGLWAATVRVPPTAEHPSGRLTESWPVWSQARDWAKEQEADLRRGAWIDPRRAEVLIGAFWATARAARGYLEMASQKRDDSHWRNHVGPYWGMRALATVTRPVVQTWVDAMRTSHQDGCTDRRCRGCRVGAHTIHACVSLLAGIVDVAVDEGRLLVNTVKDLKLPRLPAHIDRVFDGDEERQLLQRLGEEFPDDPAGRLLIELMFDSGARWEEAAAIGRDVWDMRRGRFQVAAVLESDGTIRPYGKREAANRQCAVSAELWHQLRPVVMGTSPGGLVFTSPKGQPLRYGNWHRRVWSRGLTVVERLPPPTRPPGRPGPMPRAERRVPWLADPQPTPHDVRHTFGTRLADEGVPEHEIAALMGHADRRSTQRYIHAGEARFGRAREALARARRGA